MAIEDVKNLMNRVDETSNPNLEVMHKYYHLLEAKAVQLNETSINRLLSNLKKNGGAIISASRSLKDDGSIPEDLMSEYAKWASDTDNEDKEAFIKNYSFKKTKELISDLANSQFTHSPVYGGYKGDNGTTDLYEPSFVIYCFDRKGNKLNFDDLKTFAIELCKKYKQNSVYVREPEGKSYYFNQDGGIAARETDNPQKINRPEETYFTALKKGHIQRFTDDLEWLEEGHNSGNFEWYKNPKATDYSGNYLTYVRGEIIL